MTTSFTLQEEFALGGGFTWRLKESEIRYRGSGTYSHLINQRIPASDDRIADFIDALTLACSPKTDPCGMRVSTAKIGKETINDEDETQTA